jgi:hypothetical protein
MKKNSTIYLVLLALFALLAVSKVIEALQLSQYLFVHENEDYDASGNVSLPPHHHSLRESSYWGRRLQSNPCACNRDCTVVLGRNICYVDGGLQCPFAIPSLLQENQAWIDCPADAWNIQVDADLDADAASLSASVGEGIGGDNSEGIDTVAESEEDTTATADVTASGADASATAKEEVKKVTTTERHCAGPDGPCVEKTCFGPGEPCILKGVKGRRAS